MAAPTGRKLRILGAGLDAPSSVSFTPFPIEELKEMLAASLKHLEDDPAVDMTMCWLSLSDKKPADAIVKYLQDNEPYDGVMIGWGVRGIPENSWLLEECVEAIRDHAPKTTKFLFSTTPSDHMETVYRKFPDAKPLNA